MTMTRKLRGRKTKYNVSLNTVQYGLISFGIEKNNAYMHYNAF